MKKYNIMTRQYKEKLLVFLYENTQGRKLENFDTIDVIFLTKYCDENLRIEYGYNRFDLRVSDIEDLDKIEDSVYHYAFVSQDYEFYCTSERANFNEVIEQLIEDVPNIESIFKKYHENMFLF